MKLSIKGMQTLSIPQADKIYLCRLFFLRQRICCGTEILRSYVASGWNIRVSFLCITRVCGTNPVIQGLNSNGGSASLLDPVEQSVY